MLISSFRLKLSILQLKYLMNLVKKKFKLSLFRILNDLFKGMMMKEYYCYAELSGKRFIK